MGSPCQPCSSHMLVTHAHHTCPENQGQWDSVLDSLVPHMPLWGVSGMPRWCILGALNHLISNFVAVSVHCNNFVSKWSCQQLRQTALSSLWLYRSADVATKSCVAHIIVLYSLQWVQFKTWLKIWVFLSRNESFQSVANLCWFIFLKCKKYILDKIIWQLNS